MNQIRASALLLTAIGLTATGCGTAAGGGSAPDDRVPVSAPGSRSSAARPAAASTPQVVAANAGAGAGDGAGDGRTATASGGTAGSQPVLSWTGLAGIPLGSGAPAFATALRHRLDPLDSTDRQVLAEHRCVYRHLSGLPGVALRVTGSAADGPVRVISLTRGSPIRTSAGIGLGDTLDDARRSYGAFLLDLPFDFYPEDGHALTAQATGEGRWVFIADRANRLVEIRLGGNPDVYSPEGCV